MKNKVLVHLKVPEIDETYDIFVPINIRIGTLVGLITKSVNELSGNVFELKEGRSLYNTENSKEYDYNMLVRETNIRNGTTVVLM